MERGEHGHPRRLEPHLHVAGDDRLRLPQAVQHRARGPHDDARGPGLELGDARLPIGTTARRLDRRLSVAPAPFCVLVQRVDRMTLAALFERRLEPENWPPGAWTIISSVPRCPTNFCGCRLDRGPGRRPAQNQAPARPTRPTTRSNRRS